MEAGPVAGSVVAEGWEEGASAGAAMVAAALSGPWGREGWDRPGEVAPREAVSRARAEARLAEAWETAAAAGS